MQINMWFTTRKR